MVAFGHPGASTDRSAVAQVSKRKDQIITLWIRAIACRSVLQMNAVISVIGPDLIKKWMSRAPWVPVLRWRFPSVSESILKLMIEALTRIKEDQTGSANQVQTRPSTFAAE